MLPSTESSQCGLTVPEFHGMATAGAASASRTQLSGACQPGFASKAQVQNLNTYFCLATQTQLSATAHTLRCSWPLHHSLHSQWLRRTVQLKTLRCSYIFVMTACHHCCTPGAKARPENSILDGAGFHRHHWMCCQLVV